MNLILIIGSGLIFKPFEGDDELYQLIYKISNIFKPSTDDYRLIQNYMETGKRPYLNDLDQSFPVPRRTTRAVKYFEDYNEMRVHKLQNSKNVQTKKVLISYATLNGPYSTYLNRSLESYKKFERDYDIYFMIGGFPSVENYGVGLFFIPYAWKVALFKKMQEEGYEKILWVDAACYPLKNPSELFNDLERRKILFYHAHANLFNAYNMTLFGINQLYPYKKAFQYAGIDIEHFQCIPHIQATVFGLDLRSQKALDFLKIWLETTLNVYSSISYLPEELILSAVAYQLGFKHYMKNYLPYQSGPNQIFIHNLGR